LLSWTIYKEGNTASTHRETPKPEAFGNIKGEEVGL
jgi:hypothetical protein